MLRHTMSTIVLLGGVLFSLTALAQGTGVPASAETARYDYFEVQGKKYWFAKNQQTWVIKTADTNIPENHTEALVFWENTLAQLSPGQRTVATSDA